MPNYSASLTDIEAVFPWIWGCFAICGAIVVLGSILRYDRPQIKLITLLSIGVLPVIAILIIFPVVFTTSNLLRQELLEERFWKAEVTSGVLALRVTSYLLTFQLLQAMVRFVVAKRALIKARKARGLTEDEIADFTSPKNVTEENKLWQRSDLTSLTFFQFAFYLVSLTALWLCAIYDVKSLLTALASWALFFIVDDWAVIADYSHNFDCLPLRSHALKVLAVDLLLLVAIPMAVGRANLRIPSLLLTVVMFVCLLFVALFAWRAKQFELKIT